MTEDEERQADEVNIAFQMGAEWMRDRCNARIKILEDALRKMNEYPMVYDARQILIKALEGEKDA